MDLDQATGQLKGFRRVAETEAKSAASAVQQGMSGVERTTRAATAQTETFAQGIGKLKPLAGAATGALAILGSQGGAAVSGLTRIVSGLAMTGFTPLGLAITAASVAFGIYSSRQKDV